MATLIRQLWRTIRDHRRFNPAITRLVRLVATTESIKLFGRQHIPRLGQCAASLPNSRQIRLSGEGDMVTNRVFWMGWNGYEPEMSTPFFQLAASARAAIDVGANIGYYSILAALANPSSMVVAIEPVTANLKRLSVNKCLSGTANLIIDATALGREIGRVRFRQEVGDKVGFRGGIALTYEDDPSRPDGEWETTEVPCTTVDALSHTRHISGLVDLIKMDVEGGEIDVLAGALQTLASTRPVIFSEILTMEAAREMKRILDPLGYQYFRLTDTGANEVVGDIERIQEWRNFMIVAPGGRLSSEAFALCAGA